MKTVLIVLGIAVTAVAGIGAGASMNISNFETKDIRTDYYKVETYKDNSLQSNTYFIQGM